MMGDSLASSDHTCVDNNDIEFNITAKDRWIVIYNYGLTLPHSYPGCPITN